MKHTKRRLALVLLVALLFALGCTGCGESKETVLIYTSSEDYRIEDMSQVLAEKFPDYNIIIEYMSTGNHAAKLLSEGTATECDITHDLEYGYLDQLEQNGILADLSAYDRSIYMEDTVASDNYVVEIRNSGAIIINTKVLADKNLPEPTSYQDLLKPEYKGLISMPNPKASGTGYMFLKSLVNAWGEEAALKYFDDLAVNVLQFTSSGSGPVNALVQGEVAVGLGMTAQAVVQINQGTPLKVLHFEEGAPFTLYGQSIIKGKETRPAVQEVFDYLVKEYNFRNNEKFFPEQIYKDITYTMDNYPTDIAYSDMKNNTLDEKTRLLDQWKH